MPDIFDEVDEDLRADKAQALLRRYGGALLAAMALTLIGVGAYTYWDQQRQAAADQVANRFLAAQKQVENKASAKAQIAAFAPLAATAPEGYRMLARLQLAAAEWNDGQHGAAIAEWQRVSDDATAPQIIRDLAVLLSVQHQADSGDAQLLKSRLQPLMAPGNRWRPMAEQTAALLDIRLNRGKEAREIMKSLAADTQAPSGVREMAQDLYMTLSEDGAGPHG